MRIARYGPVNPDNRGHGNDSKSERLQPHVNGLLQKRADLYNEGKRVHDRLAEIKNDMAALDRTLSLLGDTGDPGAAMPRQKWEVIFGRGELSKAIYGELTLSRRLGAFAA